MIGYKRVLEAELMFVRKQLTYHEWCTAIGGAQGFGMIKRLYRDWGLTVRQSTVPLEFDFSTRPFHGFDVWENFILLMIEIYN